jgi:hypothetical protein
VSFSRVLTGAIVTSALFGASTPAVAQTPTAQPPAGSASASAARPFTWWLFENHAYYEPLAAEPRAAQVSALALAHASEYPFVLDPGSRRIWDISLGKEIPVFGADRRRCRSAVNDFNKGCWGFGVWAPVSFHMVEDFKDDSKPILNTDYRFGVQLKARYAATDTARLAARLQIGHESTHVGDEFVVHAVARYGAQFERVNVSYEYWDLGLSYEQSAESLHSFLTFRAGAISLLNQERGFYSTTLLTSDVPTLTPSVANREPYLGVEWSQDDGGKLRVGETFFLYASVDARYKTVYGYHRASPTAPDMRKWSINTVLGLNHSRRFNQKGVPELFIRYYRGVNPNGQFRSQHPYTQFGIGIRVPV